MRTQERQNFDTPTRICLLETDMDKDDEEKATIRAELKGIGRIMVGLLVALSTTSIMLAANVVLNALGK